MEEITVKDMGEEKLVLSLELLKVYTQRCRESIRGRSDNSPFNIFHV